MSALALAIFDHYAFWYLLGAYVMASILIVVSAKEKPAK
jgi:hypothetical protein